MTALAANTNVQKRNTSCKRVASFTIKTSSVIYAGALVCVNAAGAALALANSATLKFVGMATEAIGGEFPLTGDGTKKVTVEYDFEALIPAVTAVTAGMSLTTKIYGADDATASNATTLGPLLGPMTELAAANSAWVHLRGVIGEKAAS